MRAGSRYLGVCKYDEQAAERHELLLLWTDDQSGVYSALTSSASFHQTSGYAHGSEAVCFVSTARLQLPAITELWSCFAERQMKIADAPANEAVIISELVIGAGPICKARDCNSWVLVLVHLRVCKPEGT